MCRALSLAAAVEIIEKNTQLIMILFLIFNVNCFPSDLTVYEFGSREHAFGGLRWDDSFNHPKPYAEPVNDTIASLFQYITPDPMPSKPFPTNEYSICWNMNVKVFGRHQTILMRLFHDENTEWSEDEGDYWHQLNYAPNRGTLIMRASMLTDKSKKNVWSGGLGVGNYTTEDNAMLRWTSICIANDFQNCLTRYFIGMYFFSSCDNLG